MEDFVVEQLQANSKPYGKISIKAEQLLHFSEGLLGFENIKYYYLLDHNKGPFYWLQSLEITEVAFVIINPMYFKKDYFLELSEKDFIDIGLRTRKQIQESLLHFVIITLPSEDPKLMTANLSGPIIINKELKIGKQALSLNHKYSVKNNILSELEISKQV